MEPRISADVHGSIGYNPKLLSPEPWREELSLSGSIRVDPRQSAVPPPPSTTEDRDAARTSGSERLQPHPAQLARAARVELRRAPRPEPALVRRRGVAVAGEVRGRVGEHRVRRRG